MRRALLLLLLIGCNDPHPEDPPRDPFGDDAGSEVQELRSELGLVKLKLEAAQTENELLRREVPPARQPHAN